MTMATANLLSAVRGLIAAPLALRQASAVKPIWLVWHL